MLLFPLKKSSILSSILSSKKIDICFYTSFLKNSSPTSRCDINVASLGSAQRIKKRSKEGEQIFWTSHTPLPKLPKLPKYIIISG